MVARIIVASFKQNGAKIWRNLEGMAAQIQDHPTTRTRELRPCH
ncbi:hypothetical protein [Halorhodospira sp. 9622]|nr:hypothetical protein [Halorhodospira sp. 9622]